MAFFWVAGSGNWYNVGAWGGQQPGAYDVCVLSNSYVTTPYTVTINTPVDSIGECYIISDNATLDVQSSLSIYPDAAIVLNVGAGTLLIEGSVVTGGVGIGSGLIQLNGGTAAR
jgi:hypothetical protein